MSRVDRIVQLLDEGLLDMGKQSSGEWGMPLEPTRSRPRIAQTDTGWEYHTEGDLLSDSFYVGIAYIFNPLSSRYPVYHGAGGAQWNADLQEHVTACGLVTFRWRRGNDSFSGETLAVRIQKRHAALFARACKRCFRVPETEEQT